MNRQRTPIQWNVVHTVRFTLRIQHRKVMPRWPRANGEAERFMNTLKKALQIANINRQNWRQELQMFLRSYRTTPHSTTQVAPHTLLFNREPKTKLGQASNSQTKDDDIRNRDKIAKQRMKAHADRTNKAANRMILQGDHVLVKNEQASKLTPTYDPCHCPLQTQDNYQKCVILQGHPNTRPR